MSLEDCACANVSWRCIQKQSLKMIGCILTLVVITAFDWSNDVTETTNNAKRDVSNVGQNLFYAFYASKSSNDA